MGKVFDFLVGAINVEHPARRGIAPLSLIWNL
jgi:hypothetical protein